MDQQTPSIEWLLSRFFSGEATAAEKALLFEYLKDPVHDATLKQWINSIEPASLNAKSFPEGTAKGMLEAIFRAGTPNAESYTVIRKPGSRRYWYAAAILLVLLGAGTWFLLLPGKGKTNSGDNAATGRLALQPIQPGSNKAVLILGDGREVKLDDKGDQLVDAGSGDSITRSNAMLDYTDLHRSGKNEERLPEFHTLSTPKGGQFQLTLSDGSRVWLNAASAIRFPATFGAEREIEVKGEVYVEVKQDPNKPFIIRSTDATVQVLGTSININAYENEDAVNVTLVNGSVRVLKGKTQTANQVVLHPGQQAQLYPGNDKKIEVKQVDVQQQIAWKNGLFSFKSTDIAALMRQMERWYNVNVIYPKGIPADRFSGTIPRSVNLNQFLDILQYSDIKATVDGKSVIIKP
ncbi:MAG: FecR family protein [Pseudobacter sp.]|uniref:FecR family protein n=1 Tax=Pseudobacter sp. TaxID=2045420 RepID=UPI003F7D7900